MPVWDYQTHIIQAHFGLNDPTQEVFKQEMNTQLEFNDFKKISKLLDSPAFGDLKNDTPVYARPIRL